MNSHLKISSYTQVSFNRKFSLLKYIPFDFVILIPFVTENLVKIANFYSTTDRNLQKSQF